MEDPMKWKFWSKKPRLDAFANAITGLGYDGRDKRLGASFYADVVEDASARELWRGNDLAAAIIEKLPGAMFRAGFEVDQHVDEEDDDAAERAREESGQIGARLEELSGVAA